MNEFKPCWCQLIQPEAKNGVCMASTHLHDVQWIFTGCAQHIDRLGDCGQQTLRGYRIAKFIDEFHVQLPMTFHSRTWPRIPLALHQEHEEFS